MGAHFYREQHDDADGRSKQGTTRRVVSHGRRPVAPESRNWCHPRRRTSGCIYSSLCVAGGKSDALAAPAPVATRRGSKVKSCATRATFILHMTNLLGVRLSVIMLNVRIAVEITAYCPLDMADCVCMTFLRIDRIDAVPGVPAKGAANAVR